MGPTKKVVVTTVHGHTQQSFNCRREVSSAMPAPLLRIEYLIEEGKFVSSQVMQLRLEVRANRIKNIMCGSDFLNVLLIRRKEENRNKDK
ncbi:hypothetical protein EVAR_99410_1 [Eumeta japonica]|uniref:Uncharacterized protein n=1 Tax=Eumeta variegata TaxID=151549 RepID=A0A4C1ZDZ1_EUMVA|nr:hypothetical protein EVAR_99410_1 [Eumeta japonica]